MLDKRPWFAGSELVNAWAFDKYMQMSPWKDKQKPEKVFDGMANNTMKLIEKMPNGIRLTLLGLIHSKLRPNFYILKNTICQLRKKLSRDKDANSIGIKN